MRQNLYIFILLTLPLMAYTQEGNYVQTEATITNIEFKRHSKISVATAYVDYKTQSGEQLSSRVDLPHIPYIAPIHRKGQTIKVQYLRDAPHMLKVKSTLFIETYGLYIFIFFGVLISLYRLFKYLRT